MVPIQTCQEITVRRAERLCVTALTARLTGPLQLATLSGYIGKVVVPWMVFADGSAK